MQAYGPGFARIYNLRWTSFANQAAPLIHEFYATTPIGRANKRVLDLCCGTGQLAVYFLDRGYTVVGLDLSDHMLRYAQENAYHYVESGQVRFIQGDASHFTLDERCGLVVSTFDALNHLENEEALRACFQCVYTVNDGYFIFDLNTRAGLQRWNNIHVDESSDEAVIISRGLYDEQNERAWTRISGFVRTAGGLYQRFEETAFNTVFDLERVRNALLEIGWSHVYFARLQALAIPLPDPEQEGRVFIVACK